MIDEKKQIDNLALLDNMKKTILERLNDRDYVLIWNQLEKDLNEVNNEMKIRKTSIKAYREKILSETVLNDYSMIWWTLNWNEKPMTYSEIAKDLNWTNPNKVSRRTKEMVEMGLIKECEVRICKIAGSNCLTYMVCW
jgi:hypothetical protein